MRILSSLALVGLISLGLVGCGANGGTDTAETPPAEVPTATIAPVSPAPSPDAAAGLPPTPPAIATLPSELINSTDPDQRIREIQRNRPDPFALIPTTPQVQIEEDQVTPPATSPSSTASAQSPRSSPSSQRLNPGQLAPVPNLVPSASPAPPPPPPTDLARAVEVSGVIQIGSTPYAIVNAPNEPSSRYVRVGQLLSNGQVLVKRIDMYQGGEPVVILEQSGVEVTRAVGGGGMPDSTSTASAMGNPPINLAQSNLQ